MLIEKALSTWETSPEDWPNYIAFLSRLLKAIQGNGKDATTLPHSGAIASKLAQCLNPSLPSGVHQRALEVYTYIFSTFGIAHVSEHLTEYLPGLATVLSFASLSVRPGLYELYEDYILKLGSRTLRPTLRSLVLSLLPALEDETSEDFERAVTILAKLESIFRPTQDEDSATGDSGYFWQCVFLATITSPTRRQGALNFLVRRLPRFQAVPSPSPNTYSQGNDLSRDAEAALNPEPGLLIRCFTCGLSDTHMLLQRGFLDLLVTHLPLNSPVLQRRVSQEEFDLLTNAASAVVLRRDMSLNRRLWSWLLGPEPKDDGAAPSAARRGSTLGDENQQHQYFVRFGLKSLERCIQALFRRRSARPPEMARPFRICLSLMDRWEIGGVLTPRLFLSGLRSAFAYSSQAPQADVAEVLKSAGLFFDGVESSLIWSELLHLLENGLAASEHSSETLHLFGWVLERFNVKEDDMVMTYVPLAALYLLDWLVEFPSLTSGVGHIVANNALLLLQLTGSTAFGQHSPDLQLQQPKIVEDVEVRKAISRFLHEQAAGDGQKPAPWHSSLLGSLALERTSSLVCRTAETDPGSFYVAVQLLTTMIPKLRKEQQQPVSSLLDALHVLLVDAKRSGLAFSSLDAAVALLRIVKDHDSGDDNANECKSSAVASKLFDELWNYLSPLQPKHHVEAVRLVWQLDELLDPADTVKAGLNEAIRALTQDSEDNAVHHMESIRRFTTLWTHSLPSNPGSTKSDGRNLSRRGSAMTITANSASWSRRQDILAGPLLMTLDILHDPLNVARSSVRQLLINPNSLALVLRIILQQMTAALDEDIPRSHQHEGTSHRARRQHDRDLQYALQHVEDLLAVADGPIWQEFSALRVPELTGSGEHELVTWLATQCIEVIGRPGTSSALNARAISVLRQLLDGPVVVRLQLRPLEIDNILLLKIRATVASSEITLQNSLLSLTVLAMALRRMSVPEPDIEPQRSSLYRGRRKSSVTLRDGQISAQVAESDKAPNGLYDTLRDGFAYVSSRPNLDTWLDFLGSSLPFFGDLYLTDLLKLVDTFCTQLDFAFKDLEAIVDKHSALTTFDPEGTILRLLEALNMVLAGAHDFFMDNEEAEPQRKKSESAQGVLGTMTAGVFSSQGPGVARTTSKNHNRLTIIIAFQDAVRVAINIWKWTATVSEHATSNRYNAATASYNALRLRNRTRHMLEQIFTVEPLESLEVLIHLWCQSGDSRDRTTTLSLLHVMNISRAKSVVPAILDALCSRTNPSSQPSSRQSSLTVDITAADVINFFTLYLESVEDDAIDEVWKDCTTFMGDVLANPLPFRQVLPALLWVALVLAEKLDNTNFGDARTMRRNLGNLFQRLLAATFTASPNSSYVDAHAPLSARSVETDIATGRRSLDIVVILRHIVAKIESIVESPEQVTTTINSISTNVISPAFHAKVFPSTINADVLGLLARMTRKAPAAKAWRKDVADAFSRPQILNASVTLMEQYWFPVFQQWSAGDSERVHELLVKLAAPSSAGIVFGVGATAARLRADSETQFAVRRLCLLLLASPTDTHVAQLSQIEEKLVQLFEASAASSPSSAVKQELFMLFRTLVLTTSSVHLAPLWPLLNDQLQAALSSLTIEEVSTPDLTNLALLQAGKLLQVLAVLGPDEFQLHEWLYLTDTTDAVFHPADWRPASLADQVAEHLGSVSLEDSELRASMPEKEDGESRHLKALFGHELGYDVEDIKAMPREDFAKAIMRPFLGQLSINAYEGVYTMESPDAAHYRRSLLEDLLNTSTMVEHER